MNTERESWVRFLCITIVLLGAAIFLSARSRPENLPPRQPLSAFPLVIDDWRGRNVTIAPDVLSILGDGEFLERFYSSRQGWIDFFVAYFPTQRTGSTIHSPQNCLPGAGWTPIEFKKVSLTGPDGNPMTINRYIIAKGLDRELVLYWYQSHGRVVASEYSAKLLLVADSIRMNRSDGALVRIVTPIPQGQSAESVDKIAMEFLQHVTPQLDSYIPR
jgi:EpsI family protein